MTVRWVVLSGVTLVEEVVGAWRSSSSFLGL